MRTPLPNPNSLDSQAVLAGILSRGSNDPSDSHSRRHSSGRWDQDFGQKRELHRHRKYCFPDLARTTEQLETDPQSTRVELSQVQTYSWNEARLLRINETRETTWG